MGKPAREVDEKLVGNETNRLSGNIQEPADTSTAGHLAPSTSPGAA